MENLFETLGNHFKPNNEMIKSNELNLKKYKYMQVYGREICECVTDKVYLANCGITICLDCNKMKSQYHPL